MFAGIGWTTGSTLTAHILNILRSIVLARLLTQSDFGLIGMAGTVTMALAILTNIGLNNSLIANEFVSEEEVKVQLNTVWTAELARRLLLTALLLASIYPTVKFYGDDRLFPILTLLSFVPLIQGFSNPGMTLLLREVQFAKLTKLDIGGQIVFTAVSVLFVWWRPEATSLIVAQLSGAVIGVMVSYTFITYRPRLMLDRVALKRSINFGKYVFVIGIMAYISGTADNILVGKLLGPEVLGAYVVAYSLGNLPHNLVSKIMGNVLLTGYAELGRGSQERLENTVGRVFVLGSASVTLITVPVIVVAPELIHLLYGSKWMAAVDPLRILMLAGLLRGLVQMLGPLMMGLNRPDLEAKSSVIEALGFLIILYPLVKALGSVGAAWAGVFVFSIAFICRFWLARGLVPSAIKKIPHIILVSIVSGVCGGVTTLSTMSVIPPEAMLMRLTLGGFMSLTVTALVLLALRADLRLEVLQIVGKLCRSLASSTAL
jgi:O-antigen/teichoic acid export membrane protein